MPSEIWVAKVGMATVLPAPYFKAHLIQPSAGAGGDLLYASGSTIRPRIGGSRKAKRTRKARKARKARKVQKGGFLPSIGEGFAMAASKYITPIALYGMFRFIRNRLSMKSSRKSSKKSSRKTRKHK
jgi:hypothetical protein